MDNIPNSTRNHDENHRLTSNSSYYTMVEWDDYNFSFKLTILLNSRLHRRENWIILVFTIYIPINLHST